jgi:hypothetical protein
MGPATDSSLIFEHRHPADGALRLVLDGEVVHVDCRWPFDPDVGDWIDIATEVSVDALGRCAEALGRGRTARAKGPRGGFIEFAPRPSGGSTVEVADRMGEAPRRLSLILAEPPEIVARGLCNGLRRG